MTNDRESGHAVRRAPANGGLLGRDGRALVGLAERSPDALAVLDADLRVAYVNPPGCELLGRPAEELVGSRLAGEPPVDRPQGRMTTVVRVDGHARELEFAAVSVDVGGEHYLVGILRDVGEAQRAERWAAAFALITSRMATGEGAEAILEQLSRSVVDATGMSACAVILFDEHTARFRVVGAHGLPMEYRDRFEDALAAGVDLPETRSFRDGRIVIQHAEEDPLVAGWSADRRQLPWSTIACAPMIVGGRACGVVKGFLRPAQIADDGLLAFLDGIGDQAAVAVENARLFAEARESSRRQEVLVQAGLTMALELSLPSVLARIVEFACDVANATYGALGVLGPDGGLEDFVTHGVTDAQRAAIGSLPVGHGLLGALITDPRPVRLRRLQADPRSGGFPPHHPPMTSFLGVPVTVRGQVYGNLYLTDKRDGTEFTDADERAVVTLAAQAGIAIENARLFTEAQQRLALEERTRLARELHDSVSQALFAMTLETGAATLAIEQAGADPAGVADRLARLRTLTEGALAEMRALIFALRPEAIREEGLVAAIRKQAEGVAAREELAVTVVAPDDRLPLPPDVEEQLYRVSQEALSNVAKHAEATHVAVRLALESMDVLVLEIRDDGSGFDPSAYRPGHLGLRSMTERAEALGGELSIVSEPGYGTLVRVTVPVPNPRSEPPRHEGAWPA